MRAKVNRDPRARQPLPGTLAPETLATLPERWHGLVLQAIFQSPDPKAFINDQLRLLHVQLQQRFNHSPAVCEQLADDVKMLSAFLMLYYDVPVDCSPSVIQALSASMGPERYTTIIYDLLTVVTDAWKVTLNDLEILDAAQLESQWATIKRLAASSYSLSFF
jgi:hypothetical protein